MYNRNDPRFRRTLNQISQNLESANESAQVGLFSFSENYLKPCLSTVATSLEPCTAACFPSHRDRLRRQHHHHHQQGWAQRGGRLEHSFDFYDDWDEDENDALLSLEDGEFDRVVGGYGTQGDQEPRERGGIMNYGARGGEVRSPRSRRKSAVLPYNVGPDPTVIPNQSYFGFLSKLPFNLGRGGLKYKPSAADLRVRPKGAGKFAEEDEPLLEEEEGDDVGAGPSRRGLQKGSGRARSGTTGSGHTTDSYSSRGDIFPSDDEDDAVPIDDEFTVALEHRTSNPGRDDSSSGKTKSRRKTDAANPPSDPPSSKNSTKARKKKRRRPASSASPRSQSSDPEMGELSTLAVLKQEEQRAQTEEEEEIEKKRDEAQKLAEERGLATPERNTTAAALAGSLEPRTEKESPPAPGQPAAFGSDPRAENDIDVVYIVDGPISMEDNEQQPMSRHPGGSE